MNNEKKFIKLTPFKMQILQTFPFIDADFDAITNYELLCKVVEYLNITVDNVNILNDEVKEYINKFNELKSYVDNYFTNLDVQQEINNKLDEMAKDGTLTYLIENYVNPIIDAQNARLTSMENQIENITNWSPIPVTSINDMTDTTKIYLLTNTGYWYYHNGTTWTQGAKYQTISEIYDYFLIDNNAIPNSKSIGEKINDLVETKNYFNKNDFIDNSYYSETGEIVSDTNYFISNIINVKNGDKLLFLYDQEPRHAYQLIKVTNTGAFISMTSLNVYVKSFTEDGFYRIVVRKTTTNEQVEIVNTNLFAIYKNIPSYSLTNYKYNLKIQEYIDSFNKFLNDNTTQFNYLDYSSSLDNHYIDDTNRLQSSNSYLLSNPIKVNNGDTLYMNWFGTGANPPILLHAWEYNEDMQPLKRVSLLKNSYTASHNGYVTFNIEKRSAKETAENTIVISKNETVNQFYPFRKYLNENSLSINIKKINDKNYLITYGDFKVTLFKTDDNDSNSHNWNLKEITNKAGNVIVPSGTDIIGPVKINDNTDFIGGVHGDETTDYITIGINGSSYNLNEINEINGDNMTITMKSSVYDQNTHNKIFDRFITIYIAKNYIKVNNSYRTIESCTLKRATNGGLIACLNNIIKDIIFNNSYYPSAPTESVVNSSPYNTNATINTIYGSITVNNIKGYENENYRGMLNVFTNENPMRCKIYFDTYRNGNYTLNVNDMIIGEFEYIFS